MFIEYRGSRDSPSAFCRGKDKFPTMDSELAAAMEPLNPNQNSADSLAHDAHPHQYTHHNVASSTGYRKGRSNMMPMSTTAADYYISEKAHPFSTFQPSRHNHRTGQQHHPFHSRSKPSHSISAEYIPYIDKTLPPPDLAHVLHQLRAPTQPPQAVVAPVHSHRRPMTDSSNDKAYEEPGAYCNNPVIVC